METFSEWLQKMLDEKGWSRAEAARRGGVSSSMYDKVIKQEANPGPKFCLAVAVAFDLDLNYVLEKAGKGNLIKKAKNQVSEEATPYNLSEYARELQKRIDRTIEEYFEEIGIKRIK